MADRPGDFRGRERRGPDLVEQRLKQMMVALIDDGDAHARAGRPCARPAAEAGADDHNMMRAGPRSSGGLPVASTAYPAAIQASRPPNKGRTSLKP